MAPPATTEAQRQRSILADLLAAIEPERADDIALLLLYEFRTLGRIWSQSPEALARVLGADSRAAMLLLAARDATLAAMRCDIDGRAIDPHDTPLCQYLVASMGSLGEEVLRVLFLDAANRLVADEQMQWGGLAQVALHPRNIFRRAMELGAAGIILVHNHPSGDQTPSPSDVEVTDLLRRIGRWLEIAIVGHIVVSADGWQHVPAGGEAGSLPAGEVRLRDGAALSGDIAAIERAALENARRTLRRRTLRRTLIGSDELFGEPGWEMLIDLFIHGCEGKRVSTSSLCIASGAPPTTALRLLHRLCEAGILTRQRDPRDGRLQIIELAPEVRRRLLAYFAAASGRDA